MFEFYHITLRVIDASLHLLTEEQAARYTENINNQHFTLENKTKKNFP